MKIKKIKEKKKENINNFKPLKNVLQRKKISCIYEFQNVKLFLI